jgi:hypothetical protein
MAVTLDGLAPEMRRRTEAFLADPESRQLGLFLRSAFRSRAEQEALYAKYLAGGPLAARPGTSLHELGLAVDVGIPGVNADADGDWRSPYEEQVNAIGARHGLFSPIDREDWHFEQIPNWRPPAPPATPPKPQEDDMAPIAGTPPWVTDVDKDVDLPRFIADSGGDGSVVVASVEHAVFHPPWRDGQKTRGFEDFTFLGLWWRRFPGAGRPLGFAHVGSRFVLFADHGTFDLARKP